MADARSQKTNRLQSNFLSFLLQLTETLTALVSTSNHLVKIALMSMNFSHIMGEQILQSHAKREMSNIFVFQLDIYIATCIDLAGGSRNYACDYAPHPFALTMLQLMHSMSDK